MTREVVKNLKGVMMDTLFFWKKDSLGEFGVGCLSQWADYGFVVDNVRYRNAEQFMMAGKADYFHDPEAKRKIMVATTPGEMKELGRNVRFFDEERWAGFREELVVRGNLAKFTQNPKLKKFLLGTGEALLAEASPSDKVWGIGLDAETAAQMDPDKWPGQNLLGKALMKVRDAIRKAAAKDDSDEKKLIDDYCFELYRTDKKFLERVREGARVVAKDLECHDAKQLASVAATMVMKDEGPLVEFDRIYKPYVLGFLSKAYGFEKVESKDAKDGSSFPRLYKNGVDAEDVYDDVLAKLLCGPLWSFDLDGKNVGKGGFRSFLKRVIMSVYYDRLREDLVPEVDADGNPVYTGEVEKDSTGKPKLDEYGQPIFKRKMVSKYELHANFANDAAVQGRRSAFEEPRERDTIGKYMVRLSAVAYLLALNDLMQRGRSSWGLKAVQEFFEGHKSNQKLVDELVASNQITQRCAWDVKKHRFVENWKDCLDRLAAPVINARLLGIEGYSMKVVRQMRKDLDAVENYVRDAESEVCALFGKDRWKNVVKALSWFADRNSDADEEPEVV